MASQAVLFLTAAFNVVSREESSESGTEFGRMMSWRRLENEEFLNYFKTSRGKGETLKLCEAWGEERSEFATLALLLRAPLSPAKTRPVPGPAARLPLPQRPFEYRGRTFTPRQVQFFLEVSTAYLESPEAAK